MTRSLTDSLAFLALAETRWGPRRHWACVYCGRRAGSTADHFWPLNDGGTADAQNAVPCCDECNKKKSDRAPIAWMVAVGVPERRIARIVSIVMNPGWSTDRMPTITPTTLDYAAGRQVPRVADRPAPALTAPDVTGLPESFVLDPDSWLPRAALWDLAQSADPAAWPTPQALYADLRARGFREMKRMGARGFWGLRVEPDEHDVPAANALTD
ncbi:HNH endonuclease [Microbacterium sp. 179-B 1A2 NHS]|uniref:HNH endonuclease n=1 Tax=Microbacterium sp. 179-B 1A2 NHS TaxID=3142383 RepID=UPI00399FAE01